MSNLHKILLACIIFLAIFFRFYLIETLPSGLSPDEAANGLDVISMEQGKLQPFYERQNGRESLFFYLLWGSVSLFGKGYWQHHIVSSAIGVISVIICFIFTRKLFSFLKIETHKSTIIALIASFLMATSSWHIVLSRTAFRANLIPLFTTLTLFFLIQSLTEINQRKQYLWSILSGTFFALGFYTYTPFRVMVPLLILITVWPLTVQIISSKKEIIKKYWLRFTLFILSFLIFIFPLANYFINNPNSFINRSSQISIWNQEPYNQNILGSILDNTKLSLLAFFTNGDINWRHNISGHPFLSPLISLFFLFGLTSITLLAIGYTTSPKKYQSDWKFFLLAGFFWSMLLPEIISAEGIPHGLRSIGTIPAVFIITAWGLFKFYDLINTHLKKLVPNSVKITVVASLAIAITVQTYALYFIYAKNNPEYFFSFRSDLSYVSEYLKKYGNKTNTYLVLDLFSIQTVDYLTFADSKNPENPNNNPYKQVDPGKSSNLQNLTSNDKIIFTESSLYDRNDFKKTHPTASLTHQEYNQFGKTIFAVYTIR